MATLPTTKSVYLLLLNIYLFTERYSVAVYSVVAQLVV